MIASTLLRFFWRAGGLASMRLFGPFLLIVVNAALGRVFSFHQLDFLMYLPAAMVAAFTLLARHERRDARAYLKTLPIPPGLTGTVETACDLVPPLAIGLVATAIHAPAAFTIPLLGLAALWGIAWSEGDASLRTTAVSLLSFALLLALLHRFPIVGTTVACLGVLGWLLLRQRDGDELSEAPRVTPESLAAQTIALPFGGSRLLVAHALGGMGGLGLFAWSGVMTFFALRFMLTPPMVFFPMLFGVGISAAMAERLKGPAREFLLSRPIRRWSYFALPVVILVVFLALPSLAEWGQARRLSEPALDAQIRAAVRWDPYYLRSEQDWRGFYQDKLSERFGLGELPDGALEPNPVPHARPAYVPTARLRAATRAAWKSRQLGLALLTMVVVLFGFAFTKGADPAGAKGPRRAVAWIMAPVAAATVGINWFPRMLQLPLWPLLGASLIAVAVCWRSVASDDA